MKVRYIFCGALLAAMGGGAQGNWIGNPLVPGAEASDLQPYVYNVYYGSPMISSGTVYGIAIYQMDFSNLPEFCDSFTVRLLHATGVEGVYEQYYTSPVFGVYGAVDAVQTYWFGEDVQVAEGDLFVTYGGGIPFTVDASSPDTYYFTGQDFAPTATGLVTLGGQTYVGNRIYSAAVYFTPAPGSAGSVPEPGSLALMMAGGIWLMRRPERRGKS